MFPIEFESIPQYTQDGENTEIGKKYSKRGPKPPEQHSESSDSILVETVRSGCICVLELFHGRGGHGVWEASSAGERWGDGGQVASSKTEKLTWATQIVTELPLRATWEADVKSRSDRERSRMPKIEPPCSTSSRLPLRLWDFENQ